MGIKDLRSNRKIKINIKDKISFLFNDKMFILVLALILIKNQLFMNILKTSGAASFKFPLDTYSLLNSYIYILFILIFLSFTFLFHNRAHLWALVIFNLIFSILVVGDLWNYRGFNSFLSFHMLSETSNLNNLSDGVISMARPIDLVFIVDNIVLIPLAIFLNRGYKKSRVCRGVFTILFIFSTGFILFFHAIFDYHGSGYEGPTLFKTQWIPYATMRCLSPLGYHYYDTVMFVDDHRPYMMTSSEKNQIDEWMKYKNEDLPDNKYSGIFKGKNLIVIQVESLENFILNHKYGDQELTPNLNNMLKNSIYFSNYFEQVNNGTSSDADLMTNASVFPVRRGSTFFRFPNNQYNTLPMIFKSLGYATKAYHADYGYYWNVQNALINFGFDQFMDEDKFPKKDAYWMGLTDECFLSQTADFLSNTKQPFYSFQVTTTSHMPFKLRADMKTLNLPKGFDDTYMGGYYQSFHYTDKQIGNFIDTLDKKGILDNTVVAIYGDHTSIHKYYADEVAKMQPQEPWWNNGYRIPLIIYSKGMKGEEIKTNGGQIDILPTLAYTFGIDKSKYQNTSMGRNLLNTNKSYAILSNGTIMGKESLTSEDLDHINQSFQVSDEIIRANYFKQK
jgi:Phosphoglycerol transferase and related proteins, alkaline phosphatase superfamily